MEIIIIILLSLSLGSFGNNVISYFIGESKFDVTFSRCNKCNKKLTLLELIPTISYLFLKGKCSLCDSKISARYILVEIGILILGILCFLKYSLTFECLLYSIIIYVLFLIAVIDFYSLKIPNLLIVILFLLLLTKLDDVSIFDVSIAITLLIGFITTNAIYRKRKGHTVIGYGDIKLIFVLSLIFSFPLSFIGLWLSSLLGIIASKFLRTTTNRYRDKTIFPFGSILFIGYTILALFQNEINTYYSTYIRVL